MFQARHYVEIARIIAALDESEGVKARVARHFTTELRGSNPNYSADRFEAAANGKPINGRDRA